jgi:hypothetical protein
VKRKRFKGDLTALKEQLATAEQNLQAARRLVSRLKRAIAYRQKKATDEKQQKLDGFVAHALAGLTKPCTAKLAPREVFGL